MGEMRKRGSERKRMNEWKRRRGGRWRSKLFPLKNLTRIAAYWHIDDETCRIDVCTVIYVYDIVHLVGCNKRMYTILLSIGTLALILTYLCSYSVYCSL
jgi:hypothetical protein